MEQSYNPNPAFGAPNAGGPMPKNWLVESILMTVLCCTPFGIVALINAASVNSKYASGDYAGAQEAAANAAKWNKIGLFSGLAFWLIYAIVIFFGFGSAIMAGLMQNSH